MSNKRISDLNNLAPEDVADDDLLEAVDVGDTSMAPTGTNKKFLWGSLKSALVTYFDTIYTTLTAFNDHSARHENGGEDEVNVEDLSGHLADPQTPETHASRHENGGDDEIDVTDLSGVLADPQTPAVHGNEAHDPDFDPAGTAASAVSAHASDADAHKGQRYSVERDTDENALQLVGDVEIPGNNKVYGTNELGEKGWKDDPEGGNAITTIPTTDEISPTLPQPVFFDSLGNAIASSEVQGKRKVDGLAIAGGSIAAPITPPVVGSSGSSSGANSTELTFSLSAPSADNRLLVVVVANGHVEGGTPPPGPVWWNDIPLRLANIGAWQETAATKTLQVYYLPYGSGGATGGTVRANFESASGRANIIGGFWLTGARQVNPIRGQQWRTQETGAVVSAHIQPTEQNALAFIASMVISAGSGAVTFTPGANTTEIIDAGVSTTNDAGMFVGYGTPNGDTLTLSATASRAGTRNDIYGFEVLGAITHKNPSSAPTFLDANNVTNGSSISLTLSAGTNRMVIASAYAYFGGGGLLANTPTVTFAGIPMIPIFNASKPSSMSAHQQIFWYLPLPFDDAITANVVFGASGMRAAAAFAGVDPYNPIGAFGGDWYSTSTQDLDSTIQTIRDNSLIFTSLVYGSDNTTSVTPDSSQTEIESFNNGTGATNIGAWIGYLDAASAGDFSSDLTLGGNASGASSALVNIEICGVLSADAQDLVVLLSGAAESEGDVTANINQYIGASGGLSPGSGNFGFLAGKSASDNMILFPPKRAAAMMMPIVVGATYLAESDGFVSVYRTTNGNSTIQVGETRSLSTVAQDSGTGTSGSTSTSSTSFLVRKGQYFSASEGVTAYFVPLFP